MGIRDDTAKIVVEAMARTLAKQIDRLLCESYKESLIHGEGVINMEEVDNVVCRSVRTPKES